MILGLTITFVEFYTDVQSWGQKSAFPPDAWVHSVFTNLCMDSKATQCQSKPYNITWFIYYPVHLMCFKGQVHSKAKNSVIFFSPHAGGKSGEGC